MKSMPNLVITGPPVVGKGTVCKILSSLGYASIIDTGSLVRRELALLGEHTPERNRQGQYASQQILEHGGGYFVDPFLDGATGPHMVDGARRYIEIEHLLKLGFVLLFVDAPVERRHKWSLARNSERDGLTLEPFKYNDKLEWGYVPDPDGGYRKHSDPYERNLRFAHSRAHAIITNSGTPQQLEAFVRMFAHDIQKNVVGLNAFWHQRTYHVGDLVPFHS